MSSIKVEDAAVIWHLKALEKEKELRQLELKFIEKEKELLATKLQLAEAAIQHCLVSEKKRLNVPDNWPYDPQQAAFMNPEFLNNQQQAQGKEAIPIDGTGEQRKQQSG